MSIAMDTIRGDRIEIVPLPDKVRLDIYEGVSVCRVLLHLSDLAMLSDNLRRELRRIIDNQDKEQ